MAGRQRPASNIKYQEFLSDVLNGVLGGITRGAENFDRSEIAPLRFDIQQSTAYPALDRPLIVIIVFADIDPVSAGDTVNRHALPPFPVNPKVGWPQTGLFP
jgi:hypothetical protein